MKYSQAAYMRVPLGAHLHTDRSEGSVPKIEVGLRPKPGSASGPEF